ncbi:hypothetical protein DV515_00003833, partial [Chloebia gouldiae]
NFSTIPFSTQRYCSFKNVFPPIPQPRDKFNALTDEDIQYLTHLHTLNSK